MFLRLLRLLEIKKTQGSPNLKDTYSGKKEFVNQAVALHSNFFHLNNLLK